MPTEISAHRERMTVMEERAVIRELIGAGRALGYSTATWFSFTEDNGAKLDLSVLELKGSGDAREPREAVPRDDLALGGLEADP